MRWIVSNKKQFEGIAFLQQIIYTRFCCDMIAMKREVATVSVGFPWSECQVRKLTTSHCTNYHLPQAEMTVKGCE